MSRASAKPVRRLRPPSRAGYGEPETSPMWIWQATAYRSGNKPSETEIGGNDGTTQRELAHAAAAIATLEADVAIAGRQVSPTRDAVGDSAIGLPGERDLAAAGIDIERQVEPAMRDLD